MWSWFMVRGFTTIPCCHCHRCMTWPAVRWWALAIFCITGSSRIVPFQPCWVGAQSGAPIVVNSCWMWYYVTCSSLLSHLHASMGGTRLDLQRELCCSSLVCPPDDSSQSWTLQWQVLYHLWTRSPRLSKQTDDSFSRKPSFLDKQDQYLSPEHQENG